MGCNFYVRGYKRDDDPETHIGKRSAAGLYCWDCKLTLCIGGEAKIHEGNSRWHKKCPKCGKEPIKEGFENSAGGRELGFNTAKPAPKTGAASCSSFSWAMKPELLELNIRRSFGCCPNCNEAYRDPENKIEDE